MVKRSADYYNNSDELEHFIDAYGSQPDDSYVPNADESYSNDYDEDKTNYEDNYHNVDETTARRRQVTHSHGTSASKIFLRILTWSMTILALLVATGIGVFAYYAKDAPSISKTKLQSGGSSALYTQDGKLLLSLGEDKRNYLPTEEIPSKLKDAVISIEDKRFYSETFGIDPIRIFGSTITNLKNKDVSAGGSTITQQLVKLSVFSTDASQRTLKRKIQEAWLSIQVSRQFSKEQVLEFYINKVYMNYNQYGMGTAAKYYYGKSIDKLDLAQTALLAGMPNAPIQYNPYLYPEKAKWRRDLVIQAMYNNKKITRAEAQQAINEPISTGLKSHKNDLTHSKRRRIDDPYIKEVISEARVKGFDPYNSNLKITVNLNQKAQNKLYELANSNKLPFTDKKMQVGATIVDPNNGHVVAIIGGRHLPNVQLGLNRAVQTSRSTGSSIKPILDYAPAIEYKNWSTNQILQDTPYVYSGTNVQLYDWDNAYMGPITIRYSLEQSRNVPAVKALETVGFDKGRTFAKKMGISVEKGLGLSAAIGANASSLQMAGAYSALANGGIYKKPQFISKIETPDGLVHDYDGSGTRVMKQSTAYMITDMLKGVITKGSGTSAKSSKLTYQAGKTGTVKYSNAEIAKHPSYRDTPKDSWFVGYTRNYVMSVWTGYDNLSDGKISGQGEKVAQLYYKDMMEYLAKDKKPTNWTMPDSVVKRGSELYVRNHAPKLLKKKTKKKSSTKTSSSSNTRVITRDANNDTNTAGNTTTQNQNGTNQPQQSGQLRKYYIVKRGTDGRLYYYYYYKRE